MYRQTSSGGGSMQRAIVIIPRLKGSCQECGCTCNGCSGSNSLDLHQEIEILKSKVLDRNATIQKLENDIHENQQVAELETTRLQEELARLRDRYDRLYESYKRFQKINNDLEDNLLKVVNKFDSEKTALQKEVSSITSKLIEARVTLAELEEENERYRNDCNLAVQMLHCKPSNFVAQKLNSLPVDLQERIRSNMTKEQLMSLEETPPITMETKTIRVPMPTFPPTAMVYSLNKPTTEEKPVENAEKTRPDVVPMTLVAKVLKQPNQAVKKTRKAYLCSKCHVDVVMVDKESQTYSVREVSATDFVGRISPNLKVHRVHKPCVKSESDL